MPLAPALTPPPLALDPTSSVGTGTAVAEMDPPLPLVDPKWMPDTRTLVVKDGQPVDSIYAEKQQRLLTEPLYASWASPDGVPFLVLSNVGLFASAKQAPLAPDVMLSLDVPAVEARRADDNRSYFSWIIGKMPEVVLEIVSDRRGGEDTHKLHTYARWHIPYYVIYDPDDHLHQGVLRVFAHDGWRYQPVASGLLPVLGLGVVLWHGDYEGDTEQWLRWCDLEGNLIPTGRERAEQERQRANDEKSRADAAEAKTRLLMERLRQLGETVE